MAVRFRKDRASPWQCYWTNPITGKRESESFVSEQDARRHDSLIKHRIKFERESFKEEEAEDSSDALTFESAYLLYLREKSFNKEALSWQMDAMRLPLQVLGAMPIADITRHHFVQIMDMQTQKGVKQATVRGRMSVLRTVLRWCAAKGYISMPDLPRLPAAHYERFIPPTTEELGAIMDVASPHIQRVVILGAQCGVRVGPSELLRLTWGDVDLDRQVLRVHGAKKNHAATWREVPIRDSLVSVFQMWKQKDEKAGIDHLIHFQGKPVTSIKHAWQLTLSRAGITRRIRPYDLRHAFATEAIAAGADVGTVAKLMGHSSPTMILNHYQYVMDGQKRAVVETLPDILHVPKQCAQKMKASTRTA